MPTERLPKLSRERLRKFLLFGITCIVCSLLGVDLINYWAGRVGEHLTLSIFPADLPFGVTAIGLTLPLLSLAMIGLHKRMLVLPLATLLVVVGGWAFRPALFRPSAFLHGFRTYVYEHVPVAKLNEIALAASRIEPSENRLKTLKDDPSIDWDSGRGMSFWPELQVSDEFNDMVHNAYVDMRGDYLELTWGGALVGHWGLRIYVRSEPKQEAGDAIFWQPDPKIVFFVGVY